MEPTRNYQCHSFTSHDRRVTSHNRRARVPPPIVAHTQIYPRNGRSLNGLPQEMVLLVQRFSDAPDALALVQLRRARDRLGGGMHDDAYR